uniref:Uncharacterized protein n=1 Tax=Anguilla anguilla TaxID=7936 RepID=A0A0E9Q4A7_ANGAN
MDLPLNCALRDERRGKEMTRLIYLFFVNDALSTNTNELLGTEPKCGRTPKNCSHIPQRRTEPESESIFFFQWE